MREISKCSLIIWGIIFIFNDKIEIFIFQETMLENVNLGELLKHFGVYIM